MEEISEFMYNFFAAIAMCIGISIIFIQHNSMTKLQRVVEVPVEKESYSKYGFKEGKRSELISADTVRAYVIQNKECNIFINDEWIGTNNQGIVKVLNNIQDSNYLVDYAFDKEGRTKDIYFSKVP